MLMNVVLPAPFVPMRPTTESFSIAALTSSAAVTAPKDLHSPRASRMTGIAREQRPQPFGQENDQHQQRDAQAHLPGIGRQAIRERMNRAVEERAYERGDDIARAGEDRDEDELARGRPVRHFRV